MSMSEESTSHPDKPISHFLTYRVNVLANLFNRQMERLLQHEFAIALPDWRVIAHLGQFGALSVKQLSRHSEMDKALVSRIVTRLVEREVVVSRPDERDKRSVSVKLTESGLLLYHKIKPVALEQQIKFAMPLSEIEVANLESALDKLLDHARSMEF